MHHPIKVVCVDDESVNHTRFDMIAMEFPTIQLIGSFKNAKEAFNFCIANRPDLVIADIEMPGEFDGLWLSRQLKEFKIPFAFLTLHNNFATQAFELGAIHYFLKPLNNQKVAQLLLRFQEYKQNEEKSLQQDKKASVQDRIYVNTHKEIIVLQVKDLMYAQAESAYTNFFLADGRVITSGKPLKHFSQFLENNPALVRIHRSYLINQEHLTSVTKRRLEITFTFKQNRSIKVATFKKKGWLDAML